MSTGEDAPRESGRPVLFGTAPTVPAPPDRHWFCPDETGFYCLACSLPRNNRRHTVRAA